MSAPAVSANSASAPLSGASPVPTKAAAKFPWIWPPGTTYFIAKTWIALAIGFYASFILELDGASSCGISILILAQPTPGMALSKAIYRTAGTLAGVLGALSLSAAFPQDATMLIAGFAVWIGVLTAIATWLRDFRAYGCVLAGYTVGIISIANLDHPDATFDAALNRVAAILVGVAAIMLANILLATAQSSHSLIRKLRGSTKDIIALALQTMETRKRLDPELLVDMAARFMPLRSEISFATPEKPHSFARAAGGRSALLGLMEALTAIEAVGAGLGQLDTTSPLIAKALDIARSAIKLQTPEKLLPAFDALTLETLQADKVSLEDAYVIDRLRFLIVTIGDIRDGLRALRNGTEPRRFVKIPVHQDRLAVLLNATRVMISVVTVAILSYWSGLPDAANAVLFTSVFVALGSLLPNPNSMGSAGLFGMPISIVCGIIYCFFIFPNIDGYPLFILSLLPLVALMCWLIMTGKPGYGMIIGIQGLILTAPANVQTIDPDAFVALAEMAAVSGFAIFIAFRLVIPVIPSQRRLRIALSVGTALRRALADKDKKMQPRASLHYDRLSQIKTWQRNEPVTLARRKTMQRLIDLGLLAYAVRRTWRGLDATRSLVPAALDAEARAILPTLSPDETDALAHRYMAEAESQSDQAALSLVHVAAALHGAALLTNREMRLLQHIELYHRIRQLT